MQKLSLFGFFLLFFLPPLLSADEPASKPIASPSHYVNQEHKISWPLLDTTSWSLTAEPTPGVLALIRHKEEQGGFHPTISLSFDKLPKEVSTAKRYAETNVALMPKYGFTILKQTETNFAGLPAVEVEATTDGGKKIVHQIYLVRAEVGYVLTTLCPASMEPRFGSLLKKARATFSFWE